MTFFEEKSFDRNLFSLENKNKTKLLVRLTNCLFWWMSGLALLHRWRNIEKNKLAGLNRYMTRSILLMIHVHTLPSNQFTVDPIVDLHQLFMSSLFDQTTFVNHKDSVASLDRAQSMSRDQDRSGFVLFFVVEQGILNLEQRDAGVQIKSKLVLTSRSLTGSNAEVASSRRRIVGFRTIARAMHTRCFCPPTMKTWERHTWATVSTWQMTASLATHGIVPIDQISNESMRIRCFCSTNNSCVIFGIGLIVVEHCISDVLLDRSIEENRFLANHGDLRMKIFMIIIVNILTVD